MNTTAFSQKARISEANRAQTLVKRTRTEGHTGLRGVIAAASTLALIIMSQAAAHAEKTNVRLSLDYVLAGTHAPFFVARDKGYFKDAGVTIDTIDPGKGATNVAIAVAAGTYDIGWIDMPSMISFNAKNPMNPLISVYISFDTTPLAIIARKDANIKSPKDLDGKKLAGGTGGAGHDTIGILLKAANAENVKIDWAPVQIQLYGALIKRGEVAGTVAFTNSNIPSLLSVGMKMDELTVLKYSDFGADMYGLTLATTKKFLEENPNTVRAVVKAFNKGELDTIADPGAALDIMQKVDPMLKKDIEKVRLDLSLDVTKTPWVVKHGMSVVDPKKLQFTIDAICSAYNIEKKPSPADVYTDAFLPPVAERMVK